VSAFGSDKYTNGTSQVKALKAEVAERLRYAGEAREFNASSLSKAVNIPRSTMQKYWSGDRMIGSEYLYMIADILQVNPRWLITGQGSVDPVIEMDPDMASEEDRLLFSFRQLNEEMRRHVIENAVILSKTAKPKIDENPAQSETLHDQGLQYKSPDKK